MNLKTAVGHSCFAITYCIAKLFSLTPTLSQKEREFLALLPEGEATVFDVKNLLFPNVGDSIFSLISGLH